MAPPIEKFDFLLNCWKAAIFFGFSFSLGASTTALLSTGCPVSVTVTA